MALEALHEALNFDGTFWKKVAGACWVAANDIENEAAGTDNHINRLLWAARVKKNRKAVARELIDECLENATLAADSEGATDNDVKFVVNSLINTHATGG